MAKPELDLPQVAQVLIDAETLGSVAACSKWKIHRSTLSRYRKALKKEAELQQTFTNLSKTVLTRTWVQELDEGLKKVVQKLVDMIERLDHVNSDGIEAVTSALKALAEIAITREVLSAATVEQDQSYPEEGERIEA